LHQRWSRSLRRSGLRNRCQKCAPTPPWPFAAHGDYPCTQFFLTARMVSEERNFLNTVLFVLSFLSVRCQTVINMRLKSENCSGNSSTPNIAAETTRKFDYLEAA